MTKKIMSLMLIGLLLNLAFYSTVKANDDETTQKVKTSIAKIGVGFKSIVRLKLKDGRKIKGDIREISDADFTVFNDNSRQPEKILYSQVKQIKRPTSRRRAIVYTIVFFVVWGILGSQSSDY
jgi:small nuclear ribonucleoprotein (snRNP)-like protein